MQYCNVVQGSFTLTIYMYSVHSEKKLNKKIYGKKKYIFMVKF